jgi:hypothetical protein
MIKSSLPAKIATLAITSLVGLVPMNSARATMFDEVQVIQEDFIAVAQPFGENRYNLLVIEQVPGRNTCWQEEGSNPVNVDLLLLNFDFSGHCRRSTDANGYSIRYNGNDLGLDVLLTLVERNGVLNLVGINRRDNSRMVVGSVQGVSDQPMKIKLNPGWTFSKRSYQGNVLGHVYFSYTTPETTEEEISTPTENVTPDVESTTPQGEIRDILAPSHEEDQSHEDDQLLNAPKPSTTVINERPVQRSTRSNNLFQSRFNR